MDKIKVKINYLEDISTLPYIANKMSGNVVVSQDDYAVNGKKITGLISLDLTKPMYVSLVDCTKDDERYFKMWAKDIIVKEPTKTKTTIKVKPQLYLDFDNVIANTADTIVDLYNEDFKYYDGYKRVNTVNTWNFEELSCANRNIINHYFNTERFFKNLKPLPDAVNSIKELSDIYDIFICTIGTNPNLVQKQTWLSDHIKDTDLNFIGLNTGKNGKSEVDMSGAIFVDDNIKVLDSSNARIKILFGDYGWNKNSVHVKISNWNDLCVVLKHLAEGTYASN